MKDLLEHSSAQWSVSAQTRGRALSVQVREPAMVLAVLGQPAGSTEDEVRGWLHDLAAVAREAPPPPEAGEHLPALLQQAVTALLFSHGEIWEGRGEGSLLSLVLIEEQGEVGVGWVGDGRVALKRSDGGPEPVWVRVVDAFGREGRAWRVPEGVDVRVECVWPAHEPDPGAAPAPGAEEPWVGLVAEWRGGSGAPAERVPPEAAREAIPPPAPPAPAFGDRESLAGGHEQPGAPGPSMPAWLRRPNLPAREPPQPPGAVFDPAELNPEAIAGQAEDAVPRLRPLGVPEAGGGIGGAGPPEPPAGPFPGPKPLARDVEEFERLQSRFLEAARPGPAAPSPEQAAARVPGSPAPVTPPERIAEVFAAAPVEAEAASTSPSATVGPRGRRTALEEYEAEGYGGVGTPAERRIGVPERPRWPSPQELQRPSRPWHYSLVIGLLTLLAVAAVVGLLLRANRSSPVAVVAGSGGGLEAWLGSLGWAPDRFDLYVTSQPPGASVSVDSVVIGPLTPVRLRLKSGARRVRIFFGTYGGTSFLVPGKKGESLKLDAPLWGSIAILSPEPEALISVNVDGEPRGLLPQLVDRVAPGPHRIEFSGPGYDPWERTIEVRAGEAREVLAAQVRAPGTGVLHVRSVVGLADVAPARTGDPVYIDGELRGHTPLTIELPRGPHSVRVTREGEEAPVQVVDLPGGNERFLTFEFGGEPPSARMEHTPLTQLSRGQPAVVSAALVGSPPPHVREMWLNVRTPQGTYRRYPMTLLVSATGTVGAVVFPATMLGPDGTTRYYVSATTTEGDEYFTEVVRVQGERPAAPARR